MKQFLSIVVAFLLFTGNALAQQKDMLWQYGKSDLISGEIGKVNADFISIKSAGKLQEIPVDQVKRLMFADDPSGLASVRSAVKNGQYEQAEQQLANVKVEGRPFVRQEIAFFKSMIGAKMALQGEANVTTAARELGGFLKSNANSFRYYEGCELMGHLAMALGRFESAAKYYDKLTKAKSPGLAARGSLLLGDALLLQGESGKAKSMFQRCATANDERIKAMGIIGLAICDSDSPSGAEQAIAKIEKIIDENDSSDVELFARAYNALGRAFLAQQKKESALDAFLHTDLLFYRESEKHAEALYHLANLWSEVNKPAESTKARSTLKRKYPSSVWAKQ